MHIEQNPEKRTPVWKVHSPHWAQLCAYCENNLPNQAFCERTNVMLHELQHDKGTRKTGKSKLTSSFCDDRRGVVRNHTNH